MAEAQDRSENRLVAAFPCQVGINAANGIIWFNTLLFACCLGVCICLSLMFVFPPPFILFISFCYKAFRHRGWARPLHVSDEFETETKGDDEDEDDDPSDRWGAVFSRHSVILLKDGGVPMGDDWTISVWFRGGSWLDPAHRHAPTDGRCVIFTYSSAVYTTCAVVSYYVVCWAPSY
jgi:hypothetical protein